MELGPGTGAITAELVRAFPETTLLLIEREETFIKELREKFSQANVREGNAEDLVSILETTGGKPAVIVSGLPMLSLPESTRKAVFTALERVVPVGGRFIQFTYGPAAWKKIAVPGFSLASSRRVWGNIPPAVVLTFERK